MAQNDIANPAGAVDLAGWSGNLGTSGTATPTRVTTLASPWLRATGGRITSTAAGSMGLYTAPTELADYGGVTVSACVQGSVSAATTTAAQLVAYNASGVASSIAVGPATARAAGAVHRAFVTGTAPAGTVRVRVRLTTTAASPPPAGSVMTVTASRIAPVNDPALPYGDGATPGWRWLGAEGASASTDEAPVLPPLSELADDFATESGLWNLNGSTVASGHATVNASSNGAGGAFYSSRRSKALYSWTDGYRFAVEVVGMPAPNGAANAQLWLMDPTPANGVDRLGFEYVAAANRLDFIGQTAGYAPIGQTESEPYDPVAHRWLAWRRAGTTLVWETSPDGLTWTVQRTYAGLPTWATAEGVMASLEAFRTSGPNDLLVIDRVGITPAAVPTVTPAPANPLETRTLAELRSWKAWLDEVGATGWVGEFGTVTVFGKYGDATQQAQWDSLLDDYLTDAERLGIHTTQWGSGREFDQGYPIGEFVGVAKGDPLTVANSGAAVIAAHPTRGGRWHGVNLAGHENGVGTNGGATVRSSAALVHTTGDFAFLAANGVDLARLPLVWEKLQPTLGGELDPAAMAAVETMLIAARQWGVRLVPELHNYGRYTQPNGTTVVALGGATLTDALFADFWTRFVTWLRASPARSDIVVGLGLMNEVHDLPGGAASWERASKAALAAVRATGDTRLVLVGGHNWSSLTAWRFSHPTGWITDDNFVYEAHHYFDTQSALGRRSGTYQQTAQGGILTFATENTAASTPQEPEWLADASTVGATSWAANYAAADAVAAGYRNTVDGQGVPWNVEPSTLAWPPPIEAAPFGRPGRALPLRLRDASKRYEVEPGGTLTAGSWLWIGFSFCVDGDLDRWATDYQTVWQIRPNDPTGSPPVSLEIFRDGGLHVSGGWNRPDAAGVAQGSTYQYRTRLADIEPRRWYDLVAFLGVWQEPNAGRFDVWLDGAPVLANHRPKAGTTFPTQGTAAYLKNGLYHNVANRGGTVWTANHRHGSGYGAVDPKATIAEYRAPEPLGLTL